MDEVPYFKTTNAEMYYEKKGVGPVLLFIPPPGLGAAVFEQQSELEKDFSVVTFDPRGNGKSESGDNQTLTMENWAEDIRDLIDHLDEKVILCGYSLGGTPAQITALQYPEKVKALLLVNAFPVVNTFLLSVKFKLGIWSASGGLLGLIGNGLSFTHTKKKEQQRRISANIKNSNSTLLKQMYKSGKMYDAREQLKYLTCPAFVLYGSADVLTLKYVKDFQKRIPDLAVTRIKGGAHQLPTKHAGEVNGAIRQIKGRLQS